MIEIRKIQYIHLRDTKVGLFLGNQSKSLKIHDIPVALTNTFPMIFGEQVRSSSFYYYLDHEERPVLQH
jgi:hypothetical protein